MQIRRMQQVRKVLRLPSEIAKALWPIRIVSVRIAHPIGFGKQLNVIFRHTRRPKILVWAAATGTKQAPGEVFAFSDEGSFIDVPIEVRVPGGIRSPVDIRPVEVFVFVVVDQIEITHATKIAHVHYAIGHLSEFPEGRPASDTSSVVDLHENLRIAISRPVSHVGPRGPHVDRAVAPNIGQGSQCRRHVEKSIRFSP